MIEELSAQIVARVVDGSRTEFGLRIGERTLLPRLRFLSRTTTRDSWRASSEIVIADGRTLFVIARQLADGRTELGVRVDGVDGEILPRSRFMRAQIQDDRWLSSSEAPIPHPESLRTVTVQSAQLLALGSNHSCALTVDGTVECWGSHEFGQTDAPEGKFLSIGGGSGR